MKKAAKFFTTPAATILLFAMAAVLLLGSTVGSTRAALTYYSETYASRVQMYDIGVSLVENGEKVSWRDYNSGSNGTWSESTGVLLGNMLAEGEQIQLGKKYPEALSVTNSGTIDQYVRVSLYKYWLDTDGKKMQALSPDLIDLNLVNVGGGAWILDESSSTTERTVLYYSAPLNSGSTSTPFTDTLTLDESLSAKATQTTTEENGTTTIITTYDYNGVTFQIEAEVDAVQTHNAEDAIWSAWGRKVSVSSDGSLHLN